MTEYDYSPGALERYLDKQAGITNWVDNTRKHDPANPFEPIPGEHAPSETYFQPSAPQQPSQVQYQQYLPQQYPYQGQQSYPVFYTTAQGVVSPTYNGSSKRHHHKHHHSSSHHNSGSKSLRPSPHTASSALPMTVGLTYAPTPQRSVSTPPQMPVQPYFGYQPLQQQQLVYPASSAPMVSPPAMQMQPQVQGFPFPAQQMVTSPPVLAPAISHSTSHSHSYSSRPSSSSHTRRSRSHSRDRSRTHYGTRSHYPNSPPLSYGMQSMGPYGSQQLVTSPSNQPMVVPIHGGRSGYIVVPAGQSAVIAGAGSQASYFPSSEYPYHRGTYKYPESASDSDSDAGDGFVHIHRHGPGLGVAGAYGHEHEHGHGHGHSGGSFLGSFKKLGTSLIGHKRSSSTNSKPRRRRSDSR